MLSVNKALPLAIAVVGVVLFTTFGPLESSQANAVESKVEAPAVAKALPKSAFKETEWDQLIPQDVLEVLMNPPSYITDVQDGSLEDQVASQIRSAVEANTEDVYQQALISTKVVEGFDQQPIKIPGFIVPLEFDDDQTITKFFLVPFFGACIHVPPPPPNQIIYVDFPQGLKLEALYDPFWIYGVLQTELMENDMATAAYTMNMQHYEAYEG